MSNYDNIKVGLKNIGENKIEVNYLVSLVLTIKEVGKDEVLFRYEVNGLVDFLAKGAHFLFGKELDATPSDWDSKTSQVVDLKKVQALIEFL